MKVYKSSRGKHIFFDNDIQAFKTVDPVKTLDTGVLHHTYRLNSKIFVREQILQGFSKNFIDAVDIFQMNEFTAISHMHRIRMHELSKDASLAIVYNAISKHLYSAQNISKYLDLYLQNLWMSYESSQIDNLSAVVIDFIDNHEKHK